jgi:hypothetical protein
VTANTVSGCALILAGTWSAVRGTQVLPRVTANPDRRSA